MKIAILGAESTGKTELTTRLSMHLNGQIERTASRAHLIPEYLREWCTAHARTPRPDEQSGIATEQARRINAAVTSMSTSDWVIADTTPLMIAIYSDLLFNDPSLYDMALVHQGSYDLTLVTGLDLPWVADGLQRDGPHVREPVDARIRAALARGKISYQVIYGAGDLRLANTLKCIGIAQKPYPPQSQASHPPTNASVAETTRQAWVCERCSDPDCEHRLFTSLLPKN